MRTRKCDAVGRSVQGVADTGDDVCMASDSCMTS